ncbi:MAG: ComF family protein [Oscillospiraceae bacterium]|nr:ComF family protein [Oscillospiraceae bacterium]
MKLPKIKDFILSLILTKQCRYCGELIERKETLCEDCKRTLPVIKGEKCKSCGAEKSRCDCKGRQMRYDGVTAPFYYENGIRTSLQLLKFGGRDYIAYSLAQDMAKSVTEDFVGITFDFITYIPFTGYQKRHRPYNQSELLAGCLSAALKIPCKDVLIKLFETGIQHRMGSAERSGNVLGVYDVKSSDLVKGKTVLLVDDIKTTGATLNECARILKIRGAEKVYCVTAALTGKNEKKEEDNV